MKEAIWIKLKRFGLVVCGIIGIAGCIISVINLEDWLKYLMTAYFAWLGWFTLKTGLFGSDKEVKEFLENEPVSEEIGQRFKEDQEAEIHQAILDEQYGDKKKLQAVLEWLDECEAKDKEEVKRNRQEKEDKTNLSSPLQQNAAVSQSIIKIPGPIHAEGDEAYNIGDRIAKRYEIYRIFGGKNKSGMGTVYECYDHKFREVYALKTFQDKYLSSKEMRDNFKKEALAWIHLESHPYIVRAKYVEELDHRLFVICEFISPDEDGRNTLAHYFKSPISLKQALIWSIQFCYAMEHAYLKGVTPHRDIKPDNIMITSDKTLKITDFGLAGLWEGAKISEGLIMEERKGLTFLKADEGNIVAGTPPWMAPEQFDGRADARSDIYSFGVVMYQMINNGRLPFYPKPGDDWERAHKRYLVLPRQAEGRADSRMFAIIDRCLRKIPDERYKGFKELREALELVYREITGEKPPFPPDKIQLKSWELVNKGVSLINLGLLDEAIKEYREAIRINPKSTKAHSNLGIALYNNGQLDEAIKEYKEAIRINPEDVDVYNNLGDAFADKYYFDEAVKVYKEAIKINPKFAVTYHNLGYVLWAKGHFDEALRAYKEAIKINPEDAIAYNGLGHVLESKGQLDEAIKAYREAIRVNPEYALAHNNLGFVLYQKCQLYDAIKEYKEAIRIDPEYAAAHYNIGNAFYDNGQPDGAIKEFKEAIALNKIKPIYVYAPLNFGNALADKGQLDEAIKVYREWFRVIEYFNLEIAFYDKNQINESIMACKKAVRINPEDVIAHNALGNALADKGQLDEAIAEYKEAIRIDPEYADTYYYLGYTFKAKSHFDEAINAFENFIRFFQDSEIKNAKYIAEAVRKLITQLKGAR